MDYLDSSLVIKTKVKYMVPPEYIVGAIVGHKYDYERLHDVGTIRQVDYSGGLLIELPNGKLCGWSTDTCFVISSVGTLKQDK